MASPALKRRKIDPNVNQINDGYYVELFMNQEEANKYLCVICQCVYKEPYNVGCDNEHVFCKSCLDDYFTPNNSTKSCPSCRYEGLLKNNIKPISRFAQRLVDSLKVKCPLQLEQNENGNKCEWKGALSDLVQHTDTQCPLGNIICDSCGDNMKRFESKQHDKICFEKPVPCNLQCGREIKRRLMNRHENNECSMTMLSCDDCKENLLRKNMPKHISDNCPEYEVMCYFNQYGCNTKIKRKLMDNHLKENEIDHWRMKVNSIENELTKLKKEKKEHKKTLNELVKVKQENKSQEIRIKHLEMLEVMNNKDRLLFLLKSGNAYIGSVQSHKKEKIEIKSFMNEGHGIYCIGNDIKFSEAKQIGFDAKDLNVIGNDIIFGVSEKKIDALSVDTKVCKTFTGDLTVKDYTPIYCNNYGLMIVGGESVGGTIANRNVYKIGFNNNKFTKQILTKLPYSTTYLSVCMVNDNNNNNLFCCGGWWNDLNLRQCYLYSFDNQWKELKNMNQMHQCSGICLWKERGNKIIVGGGYSDIRYVEEYDMHKNKWVNLPNLNEEHAFYPSLLTLNNILLCVGGAYQLDDNLGCIELYDPRDHSNKWIYVDAVQNYFNIAQDAGAGFNCFLSL